MSIKEGEASTNLIDGFEPHRHDHNCGQGDLAFSRSIHKVPLEELGLGFTQYAQGMLETNTHLGTPLTRLEVKDYERIEIDHEYAEDHFQ